MASEVEPGFGSAQGRKGNTLKCALVLMEVPVLSGVEGKKVPEPPLLLPDPRSFVAHPQLCPRQMASNSAGASEHSLG